MKTKTLKKMKKVNTKTMSRSEYYDIVKTYSISPSTGSIEWR